LRTPSRTLDTESRLGVLRARPGVELKLTMKGQMKMEAGERQRRVEFLRDLSAFCKERGYEIGLEADVDFYEGSYEVRALQYVKPLTGQPSSPMQGVRL